MNDGFVVQGPTAPTFHSRINPAWEDVLDVTVEQGIPFPYTHQTLTELFSDHDPVLLTLYHSPDLLPTPPRLGVNWSLFRKHLDSRLEDVAEPQTAEEVDQLERRIHSAILQSAELASFPRAVRNTGQTLPRHIQRLTTQHNYHRRMAQRFGDPEHRRRQVALRHTIRQLTDEYNQHTWDEKVRSLNTSDKSIWKMARALTKPRSVGTPSLQTDNGLLHSPTDKAELFADTLQNTFTPNQELGDDRTTAQVNEGLFDLGNHHDGQPEAPTTTVEEVAGIITRLKERKAPGISGVTNTLLKQISYKTLLAIVILFNSILRLNTFPEAWKLAKIILLLKPGKSPALPQNYRPISLLDCLSKVFERVLLNQITSYLSDNGILIPEQFGFRTKLSTTQQLTRFVHGISRGMQVSKTTVSIFLDIEKAFDKVWHDGLLYKMSLTGLPRTYIRTVRSFLQNRQFRVQTDGALSSARPILAGVPQGSCLSPTLFNLYINDMPRSPGVTTSLFADDTAYSYTGRQLAAAERTLQRQLDLTHDWMTGWRIKVNPTKSSVVVFSRRPRRFGKPRLTLGQDVVPIQKSAKYLGVILDSRLTFREHIQSVRAKALGIRHMLYPLLTYKSPLSLQGKFTLYKSLILPILTYAVTVWGTAKRTNLNQIQIIMNKTLRMVISAPWFVRNSIIYRDLATETLQEIIRKRAVKFYTQARLSDNPLVSELAVRPRPKFFPQFSYPSDLYFEPP